MIDLDEFNSLVEQVTGRTPSNTKPNAKQIDIGEYGLDPIHEGILQSGLNRVSNLFSDKVKAKISNEWKHLSNDERKTLIRMLFGDSSVFEKENANIDVALARAFKQKIISAVTSEDGSPAISINRDLDISNTGSIRIPNIGIDEVKGELKCSYSAINSFIGFPRKVESLEFVKGKNVLSNLNNIPTVLKYNDNNYAINMQFTKIDSIEGLQTDDIIKGHVSFNSCDLKSLAVKGTVYINGVLDIRNNPNIDPETLRSILIKDYSNGQIVVRGGIYHSLVEDGFYKPDEIQDSSVDTVDDLGGLMEAGMQTTSGPHRVTQQSELWRIGETIIAQAVAKKNGSPTDRNQIQAKLRPEIEGLVSNMASSQLDKNVVAKANDKIVKGMSSDEFRKLMTELFNTLLKQLTELIRNPANANASVVERTTEQVINVATDNAVQIAEESKKFADTIVNEVAPMNEKIDPVAVKSAVEAEVKASPALLANPKIKELTVTLDKVGYATQKHDRDAFTAALSGFYGILGGMRGKPVNNSAVEKAVELTFGSEEDGDIDVINGEKVNFDDEPVNEPVNAPVSKSASVTSAEANLAQGNTEEALRQYAMLARIMPNDANIKNRYAEIKNNFDSNGSESEDTQGKHMLDMPEFHGHDASGVEYLSDDQIEILQIVADNGIDNATSKKMPKDLNEALSAIINAIDSINAVVSDGDSDEELDGMYEQYAKLYNELRDVLTNQGIYGKYLFELLEDGELSLHSKVLDGDDMISLMKIPQFVEYYKKEKLAGNPVAGSLMTQAKRSAKDSTSRDILRDASSLIRSGEDTESPISKTLPSESEGSYDDFINSKILELASKLDPLEDVSVASNKPSKPKQEKQVVQKDSSGLSNDEIDEMIKSGIDAETAEMLRNGTIPEDTSTRSNEKPLERRYIDVMGRRMDREIARKIRDSKQ